ncbi:hypothetical protein MMC13_005204 [Lambiella insularis]|nr:hypothetical protein [Lambiella insularis]
MQIETPVPPQPQAIERHKHQASHVTPTISHSPIPSERKAVPAADKLNTTERRTILLKYDDNTNISREITDASNGRFHPDSPLAISRRLYLSATQPAADDVVINSDGKGKPIAVPDDIEAPNTRDTRLLYASDLEKQPASNCDTSANSGQWSPEEFGDTAVVDCGEGTAASEQNVDKHLKGILLHLAVLSPFLATILGFYAFIALLALLLLCPLRLCMSRISLRRQVSQALFPLLALHLRLIHSSFVPSPQPSARKLVSVSLLSPLYAAAIAVASWVATVFWVYAAILGEPNESDRSDNDGRAAVLGVRKWWERWLMKGAGI